MAKTQTAKATLHYGDGEFARVESEDGAMIAAAAALQDGQAVRLVFADGSRGARIDGEGDPPPVRPKPSPAPRPKAPPPGQGDLF